MDREAEFAGRIALVSGASGGIGAAVSRALARRGAHVAACFNESSDAAARLVDEIERDGGHARAFRADLADATAPAALVEQVENALGPIELLVANHGIGRRTDWERLGADDFDLTIAINLRASFLLAQRVLPGMRKRRFGRVLFTSSTAAFRGGMLGADYAASKAGLHGLAHFLAGRVASENVTVNVLAPGYIETAMLPGEPDRLAASVPVRRVGQPEEVADLALAVLGNGFITSQVLGIDGGIYPR